MLAEIPRSQPSFTTIKTEMFVRLVGAEAIREGIEVQVDAEDSQWTKEECQWQDVTQSSPLICVAD